MTKKPSTDEDSEPFEMRIDLEKAQSAPHHNYFVRLLWAMNDFLSGVQIRNAVEHSSYFSKTMKLHLHEYSLRIEQGHITEACKALIYHIHRNDSHNTEIYKWIKGRAKIYDLYQKVRDLLNMEQIQKDAHAARDNILFHYNHEKGSLIIEDAFESLALHWKKFKKQSNKSNDLNLIRVSDDLADHRYFLADHLMRFAWQRSMNCGNQKFKLMMKYQTALRSAFIEFARVAFLQWVIEYKLQSKD